MTNLQFTLLMELAHLARTQMEQLNHRVIFNNRLSRLPPTLDGGCGTASLHLMNLANKRGLYPEFVKGYFKDPSWGFGESHCWIEFADHIIDLTATQFIRCPKIFISPRQNNHYYLDENFRSRDIDEAEIHVLVWANYPPELRALA